MRAAVIAYTVNGAILAEKLRHLSDDETDIYVSANRQNILMQKIL